MPATCPVLTLHAAPRRYRNEHGKVSRPLGLGAITSPLPAELVDFGANPEVIRSGRCSVAGGESTLMLIRYLRRRWPPEHLRRISAAIMRLNRKLAWRL